MKRRTLSVLALLSAGLGAGAVLAVTREAPGTSATPTPVAAPAEPPGVGALGRVEPASRIRKLTQPGGFAITRVGLLLVAEGDRVEAGQLLAELEDVAQKDASLAQAEASLEEAKANLAKTVAGGRPSELAAQRARIRSLAAQEEIARRDAARSEQLVPSGAGAAAIAERNRAAAARAAAERAEAEAQLETLTRPRPEDVALREALVSAAEAQVTRARAEAALSRIRAPIAGTVLRVYARPGDQVGTDGLLDLADLDRMDVVADVYETDLPRLRPGAEAEVIVPGEPRRYGATVREIG
jgi:HlyD family secretion protein